MFFLFNEFLLKFKFYEAVIFLNICIKTFAVYCHPKPNPRNFIFVLKMNFILSS